MRKQHIPTLTTSALGFIAICIIAIGSLDTFPGARSQTLDNATQEQVSAAELSAAIEAQREASSRLTRSASFDQRLQTLIEKARKKGTVSVIVKVRAAFRPEGYISSAAEVLAQRQVIREAQDQMLSWLRYVPDSLKKFDYLPYIAASVDEIGLQQLQSSPVALNISGQTPLRLTLSESLHRVGAPRAWAGQFKGTGKTVAVIDSGVDKNHPWLEGKVVSEACYSTTDPTKNYSSVCPGGPTVTESTDPGSGAPCDIPGLGDVGNCGHGTHIAGIAAGRGGVAYDAKVIAIQVMSKVTNSEACRNQASCLLAEPSDVISALNRVYALHTTYDIAAVNISLSLLEGELFPDHCDAISDDAEAITAAINQLRSVNIATVISSGNDGATDAISFPACISSAISVGATGDGSASNAPVDTVLQSSNSAPNSGPDLNMLDLLAPGGLITSSVPGGGYASGSGTSMAAAHVTGAWALLKEKYPNATVDQVLNKLTTFGKSVTDQRNGVTKPRIQIDAALEVTVPPDTWIGEYYNNINLENAPTLVREEGGGFIDRNFSGVSPAPGVGTENYSIRWTRTVILTEGTYRFSVTGDDGVRLYIDGHRVRDEWRNQAATSYNYDVHLQAGPHEIRLEYYQATGLAQVRLIWGILNPPCSQTVPTARWKGEYFNNANLAGSPLIVQDDGSNNSLNFNWGAGGPSSACNLTIFPDYFSVRWTRWVDFAAGVYRFTTSGDDGARLWVGNHLLINQGGTGFADIQLSQDSHKIVLEVFETWGGAAVSLSWAQMLPPSNLIATDPTISQIRLTWTDNSSFENGFHIERSSGGGFSQIATVGANGAEYIDSGLSPSTTYTYRVRAFNNAGNSGYSNEISATTLSCNYSVSPTSASYGQGGGSSSVTVSAPAGCSWSAVSFDWITITSGTSGSGNGIVSYSVDGYVEPNSSRQGSLTVAGQTVTISQSGPVVQDPHRCCFEQPLCICDPPQLPALDQSAADAQPRGLAARYFGNMTLSGRPALERTDAAVSFTWAGNCPGKLLPADRFSVRWDGQLASPSSEAYTFYLYSDDGARLWVNNRLVIDRWQPPLELQTRSALVELKAGEKVPIRVEYYDADGDALIHLLWSSASTPKQIILPQYLYPEAGTNKSTPADTNKQMGMLRRYMFSKPVKTAYLSITLTVAIFILGSVIVSTTAVGGRLWKGRGKETAAAAQKAQFTQTVRVWVHGDRVSPDLIYARPGRILLQAENQTGGDISLKFDRRAASGNAVAQGLVRTARQGKRSSQEVTLGAGEYVFYDESRPWIQGKLIVDPQLDRR